MAEIGEGPHCDKVVCSIAASAPHSQQLVYQRALCVFGVLVVVVQPMCTFFFVGKLMCVSSPCPCVCVCVIKCVCA